MNISRIITFVILSTFVLSMPFSTISVDAQPPGQGSATMKTPGIIMKFCQNAATTLQDCDEKYEGYTHTDRIYVLVYANGFNEDSDKIESIGLGQNGYGKIKVTTRDATADEVAFTETGPDTGVFLGIVKMTGKAMNIVHDENDMQIKTMGMNMDNIMEMTMMGKTTYKFMMSAYDVAVKLPTGTQDGAVTVSWEANEDVNIVKSATWEWRLGEIEFDKPQFIKGEPITFKLNDADLWIHHADFHTYYIHA